MVPGPTSGAPRVAGGDEWVAEIITAVQPFTMTSAERIYGLCLAVDHVARHRVPGAIVECGVWRGGSAMAAARTLDRAGEHERRLVLFDTFHGMTPPASTVTSQAARRQRSWSARILHRATSGLPRHSRRSGEIWLRPDTSVLITSREMCSRRSPIVPRKRSLS